MGIIEELGAKFVALLAVVTIVYLFLALVPLLWPAARAFRRGSRLEHPWLFIWTVGALVYGSVYLVVAVIAIPVQTYIVCLAPQREESGHPYGSWLVTASRFVGEWWWPVLPIAFAFATVRLTRRLAARWPGICAALAA